VTGSFEHDNEPSGSVDGGEFVDYLSDYSLLKKDFAPCIYLFLNQFMSQVLIILLVILIYLFNL
jgi:hypothetical protein